MTPSSGSVAARMRHRPPRVGFAFVLLGLVTAILLPFGLRVAAAADYGTGVRNAGGAFLGALSFESQNAYCIELTKGTPVGQATHALRPGETAPASYSAISKQMRAQLNWAIRTAGMSSNAVNAAATQLYVWSVLSPSLYGSDTQRTRPYPEVANAVNTRVAQLRKDAAKVRVVQRPERVDAALTVGSDAASLHIDATGIGTALTVQLTGATVRGPEPNSTANDAVSRDSARESGAAQDATPGARQVQLSGERAQDVALQLDAGARTVEARVTSTPAEFAATAELRVLVTAGRQTLIQPDPAPWPSTTVRLTIPELPPLPTMSEVPDFVAPTPPVLPSEPPVVELPPLTEVPAPPAPPTTTVPATPEPPATVPPTPVPPAPMPPAPMPPIQVPPIDDEPPAPVLPPEPTVRPLPPATSPSDLEPLPSPSPEPTIPETTTPVPTPPATTETTAPAPSWPPSSTTPAQEDANPSTPQPGDDDRAALATTGVKPAFILGVAGVGLALIGLGGWLAARSRRVQATDW